jgi:hypothetical protein
MKKIIFISVIALTLLSARCNKDCESEKLGELVFTQDELNIVPYNGTETLVYKDSLNDSIVYTGAFRKSNEITYYQNYNTPASNCPGNYYKAYDNITQFNGQNNSIINIALSITSPFLGNIEKKMGIAISFINSDTLYFNGVFAFNPTGIFNITPSNAIVLSYNDSLILGPKIFYNVYTVKQVHEFSPSTNFQILYYTNINGIVGLKKEDGHLWYLSF